MMTEYTNLAQIRAQEGKSEDLGAALLALVAPSRAEPGCIAYAVHRGLDDPDLWMVYEIWTSPAELEAHFALPHMQAFVARVPDLVAGELDLKGFSRKSD